MSSNPDVIVVGGGVIGCSIAFHLAKLGVRVVLLERDQLGSGASGAASGLLKPNYDTDSFARFSMESLGMFSSLAKELKDLGGVDIELARSGYLYVALNEEEAVELRSWGDSLRRTGADVEWLDYNAVHELEPQLNNAAVGGVYLTEACRVNNQRLSEAFARAAMSLGVRVQQGVEVVDLLRTSTSVIGVRTYDHRLSAGHVVIATGAWSGSTASWLGVTNQPESIVPVRPVKGQNLKLRLTSGGIKTGIHGLWGTMVPRNDGAVLVGATTEEVGFDSRVTAEGIRVMLDLATTLVPSLKEASLESSLSGLRPRTPDDMPLIGSVSQWEGLSVATGHYRSGILLSPATGSAMADYITGNSVEMMSNFRPDRFGV